MRCWGITSLDVGHIHLSVKQFLFESFGNICKFSTSSNRVSFLFVYFLEACVYMMAGKLMHKWWICCLWSLIVVKFKLVSPAVSLKAQSCITTFCCPYDSFVKLLCAQFSQILGSGVALFRKLRLITNVLYNNDCHFIYRKVELQSWPNDAAFNISSFFLWEILMEYLVDVKKYEPLCMLLLLCFLWLVWLEKGNDALQSGFAFMHACIRETWNFIAAYDLRSTCNIASELFWH